MKRPVFINLAVDRFNAGCAHAQTDLGVPIDELCTLCTFCTFKRSSEKDEVRLTLSYAGAIQDRECFMTIARCSYCKRFVR